MHSKPMTMTPMIFKCCRKNFCFVAAAVFGLLLLRFSLPGFEYVSSYAYAFRQIKSADPSFTPRVFVDRRSDQDSHQQKDPCLGRYIYMHDLPPRFNRDLVERCEKLRTQYNFCPYVENEGFGPRFSFNDSSEGPESVMSGDSWYGTYLFNLGMVFHARMKQYECLTSDSSLASAIYAPFYPGLEAGRYLWGGFNSSMKDAGAKDFTSWLRGKPQWSHMFGWDHFFVSGRMTWDFRRPTYIGPDWGTKLMKLPETKNMTMITVDSSPHSNSDIAIPYPTYFHPSNDYEVLQWQERVRKANRSYLFAFAGASRPHMRTSIRGELIDQCKKALGNHCNLISCTPNDKVNCNSPDRFIKEFMKSDFCLQPSGDAHTRRSTFDALLAGCIPVFFHPAEAYTQYIWHLPINYTSYSVFIPQERIKSRSVRVEEVLSQISQDVVSDMRDKVIQLIPKLIYARTKLARTEDAFDIAVKGILGRIEDFRRQIQQGKNPRSRFPEELTWKYYLTGETGEHEWDSFFQKKH